MTLRHALLGVALCAMALNLLACEAPGPMPPAPYGSGGSAANAAAVSLLCERFQPGPPGGTNHGGPPDFHPLLQ